VPAARRQLAAAELSGVRAHPATAADDNSMRGRRSAVRFPRLLVAACVLSCPALALAQTQSAAARFAAADKNADGQIDRGEYYEAMVEIFFLSDNNRDGYLEFSEIGKVPREAFDAADKNHDGKLSLVEYENARFKEFDEIDTDHNGVLSITEVEAAP
jgi:Ca2+-binding EF-hand superfamily protein